MIRGNGTGHDGATSGSPHTRRPERTRGSVSPLGRARRPRTPRLTLRHRPLSTVWPCGQGEHRDGTGLLADWLLTAVVKIVTTYTEPGQRVLLLASPGGSLRTASAPAEVGSGRGHGPYAGLQEAAWTVVRLGRGIQTYTAGPIESPTADGIAERSMPPVHAPESDGDLGRTDQDPVRGGRSGPRAAIASASGPAADPSERFDLIITAVDPHAPGWVHAWDWDRLLAFHGTLAVVTHGDHRAGRLTDPTGALVRLIQQTGLTYRDHAALLWVPVRQDALDIGAGSATGCLAAPGRAAGAPSTPARVHSDLLVFTRFPAAPTTSADTETSDV
ncbi:hypothetical protein [Amycolatopsis sp.]|uniref:hypothetical protein n=1 Tax=Amycolatopsis sp. TaxID=37632 RepID=UPI002B8F9306|nr:hypothetical protein [Amycolatopsis sp.]HVV12136.1 hypothetical protein [Amycolatopsis sp.]